MNFKNDIECACFLAFSSILHIFHFYRGEGTELLKTRFYTSFAILLERNHETYITGLLSQNFIVASKVST